nr:thrombin-like enzyme AhV_TL-I [Plodia interpunctella]
MLLLDGTLQRVNSTWCILLMCLIPATNSRYCGTPRRQIIQSSTDDKIAYPFAVSLELGRSVILRLPIFRKCTGSLIKDRWVLTAGHCLSPNLRLVRCGNLLLQRNKSVCLSKIRKKIPHPEFVFLIGKTGNVIIENDIGLLYIDSVPIKKYGHIHTGHYKSFTGRTCRYAGFGTIFPIIGTPEKHLNRLLIDNKMLLQIGEGVVRDWNDTNLIKTIKPVMIVGPKSFKKWQKLHRVDSGSPLLIDDKIVGVHSVSDGLRKYTNYSFFTPISPYIDWIKDITGSPEMYLNLFNLFTVP